MIVHTMTYAEIHKEVETDFKTIQSSTTFLRLTEEYFREIKRFKIDKTKNYPVYKKIKTKAKNTWYILFNKNRTSISLNDYSDIANTFLVSYYSLNKLRVIKVNPSGGLTFFNSHVFVRFNERMNLGLNNLEKIINEFFINNSNIIYQYKDDEVKTDTVTDTFGTSYDGILLGKLLKKENVIINNTFVNKKQLFDEQIEIEKLSIENIENYINNSNLENDEFNIQELMKMTAQNVLMNLKNK
jgi:hypothetical protein